ncbi:MAG: efflux RND transporter permease subunit [Desulfobacterales bacterium]|nr:efflux RND transporter permease subunit [Desulfobacterales bacterium]
MEKIVSISVNRKVTVVMFTIAVIIFGIISFGRLKTNLLPDLSYPTVTIRTDYEKNAPLEVENLITKPIEESVGIIKNVKKVSSISRTGQSDVILEFAWGTNIDYAILEIREKVDRVDLPKDVKRPVILRFDPSMDPVVRLAFIDNTTSENSIDNITKLKKTREFAEEVIKKDLEATTGIAAIKISGGLENEVQISVDQNELARLDLKISDIAKIIAAENINLSGGNIEEGNHKYLIKTDNQFKSLDDIRNIIISRKNGISVYLHTLADVTFGHKDRTAITKAKGFEAVEIAIYKEGDANIVKVAAEISKRLEVIKKKLPSNYTLEIMFDQSIFINNAVSEVITAGIIGGLFAVIILYAFLGNIWTTLIISISIPVSVIATFNLMYGNDLSLNIMSLGGITLGIGMLLDNSIVVLENIFRHKEMGEDVKIAAEKGAKEVITAVIASTLTTIAVFFPLVFVEGIAGQLFRDQALTITFSLIISLVVALTIIPMLASIKIDKGDDSADGTNNKDLKKKKIHQKIVAFIFEYIPYLILRVFFISVRFFSKIFKALSAPFLKAFNFIYEKLSELYPNLLLYSLKNRAIIIFSSLSLLIVAILLISQMGVELIPSMTQGELKVEIELLPGTPLNKTAKVISSIEKKIKGLDHVAITFSTTGSGNKLNKGAAVSEENRGEISVMLKKGSGRYEEELVMAKIREFVKDIPDGDSKVSKPGLFTFKTPVEVEITGYNLKDLKKSAETIKEKLKKDVRFSDIKSSYKEGYPEIAIRFKRERSAKLGLIVYDIAGRVVRNVGGEIASKYHLKEQKIDIRIRSKKSDRNSIKDIKNIIINPESNKPVTLEEVAKVKEDTGPSEIRRTGNIRVITVSSDIQKGDLGSAIKKVKEIIAEVEKPSNISVDVSGQNQEMEVSFKSLKYALILAIFLVYLVMASQFESFIQPLIILFSVPLALIGASLALYFTGTKISIIVFIGAILLAGIVVNNAIVLIDRINKLREKEVPKLEAIVEAGKNRLRPILMTTLTTTLGLIPMAVGIGEGAEIRSPMAITVIGGLLGATMLTLIVIPVVYSIVDRKS